MRKAGRFASLRAARRSAVAGRGAAAGAGGGAGAATAAAGAATLKAVELGSSIKDMADRTGLSYQAVQELGYAAEQSGASIEALETGVKSMQKNIDGGSKAVGDALGRIGLSFRDLKGQSPERQLMMIARQLGYVRDPTERVGLAMKLLGKGGQELVPMLALGGDGIEKLRDKAQKLGIVMDDVAVESAEEMGDKLADVRKQFEALAVKLGVALLPMLDTLLSKLNDFMTAGKDFEQDPRYRNLFPEGSREAQGIARGRPFVARPPAAPGSREDQGIARGRPFVRRPAEQLELFSPKNIAAAQRFGAVLSDVLSMPGKLGQKAQGEQLLKDVEAAASTVKAATTGLADLVRGVGSQVRSVVADGVGGVIAAANKATGTFSEIGVSAAGPLGTFNAASAGGLFIGQVEERQLDELKKIEKNTRTVKKPGAGGFNVGAG